MKAKAAVFTGANKEFEVRSFEITPPPAGCACMELIASGVCGTDLHIWHGKLDATAPSVIGHEFIGRIVSVDADEAKKHGLKVGDAVVADIAVPCGECLLCRTGDDANCVAMQVTNGGSIEEPPYLYGGYAEYNYTPLTNLIKIPESVDPLAAAPFACPGPTAIHACSLAKQAGVDFGKIGCAVVQGLGPVGLFALTYLKRIGVERVYAITGGNQTAARVEAALALGAERVFSLDKDGVEGTTEALRAENGGIGVDLCFEASGAPAAVVQGMDILRNRGVYLIPGQYSESGTVAIRPQIITFKALHIIGSSQYSVCDVEAYLGFLKDHPELYPTLRGLGTAYTVDRVNEAMSDAEAGRNVKTLFVRQ